MPLARRAPLRCAAVLRTVGRWRTAPGRLYARLPGLDDGTLASARLPTPGDVERERARAARAPPARDERHGVRTYTIRSQSPAVDSVQTVQIHWMRGTCAVHYMDSPPRIT